MGGKVIGRGLIDSVKSTSIQTKIQTLRINNNYSKHK